MSVARRTDITMSATLAADETLARLSRAGQRVITMTSGEVGLPVHPVLERLLAGSAGLNEYGPVPGRSDLREAAAGYWRRRGLDTEPGLVVAGPGSKPLLFGLLVAIGGDPVVPVPGWVSYVAQARLAGLRPLGVPIVPGQGGVPDPAALRTAVLRARADGRDPRCVVVTVPDNPTGTVASPAILRSLAETARELDLLVVSDEIYRDLVFDASAPAVSPAAYAPERTVITTGLTKSLALGGWRIGVARLPDGDRGRALHADLVGVASQIWSSPVTPVQRAAAYAFAEPPEITAHVAASRRLHEAVVRAVAGPLGAAGARLAPVRATCYLYPDLEPLRDRIARRHHVHTGDDLAGLLLERYGLGVLPASAFGAEPGPLRLRLATSRLYGATDEQRWAALAAADPLTLPWIRSVVDRIDEVFADLAGPADPVQP